MQQIISRMALASVAMVVLSSSAFGIFRGQIFGYLGVKDDTSSLTFDQPSMVTSTRDLTARLFRTAPGGGIPGTCDTPQPPPTQNNVSGTFDARIYSFTSNYSGCMTVRIRGTNSGGRPFSAAAYSGPVSDSNPKQNLVAYSGDWVTVADETAFFSFRVTQGTVYSILVWQTDDDDLSARFHMTINDSLAQSSDFDGDSVTDSSVFRPSNGAWYILRSSDSTVAVDFFGSNGDVPLDGDFDGDSQADLAVFRPSNGTWYYKRSSNSKVFGAFFGAGTDKPVPGDYDNDGITDIGAFRDGQWFISHSGGAAPSHTTVTGYPFGSAGDIPVGSQRK